jgi:hypothetical protein
MRLTTEFSSHVAFSSFNLMICLLIACTSINDLDKNKNIPKVVSISGTFPHYLYKTSSLSDADSIVAVLLDKGEFTGGWDKLPGATIKSDGTFRLEIQKSGIDSAGNEVPNDWMLLLINSKAATRYDQVVGFIALKEIDQSLIQFPLSRLKKDTIDMGTLHQQGNEAIADTNTKYDTTAFNMTIAQLSEMAHTGRTLKMIKNSYGNWTPDKGRSIDIRPTYTVANLTMADVRNKECRPSEYLDTSKITLTLQLFTPDVQTFNYDQIKNGGTSIDLYPPGQMYLLNIVEGETKLAAINQCFSTDTNGNPMIVIDTFNHTARTTPIVIAPSGGSSHLSIIFGAFKGVSPSGTWLLKKDKSTVLSRFDLGLGCPIDSITGKPIIYMPSLRVAVNSQDTTIEEIQVCWYYWDPAAHQYAQAMDEGLIGSTISYASLSLFVNSDSVNANKENASFGKNPYFGESTSPIVPSVITFTPKQKWIFKEPTQRDRKFILNVNWCAANQVFSLLVAAMKTRDD